MTGGTTWAQNRCGFMEYQEFIRQKYGIGESEKTFENWLKQSIHDQALRNEANGFGTEEVYTIPVVVHVIHNGESLGIDANIPDEQIISQIDTLNKDFRRLNADAVNTPAEFQSVAADVRIEFALAKRDPEGLPTSGIIRKQGGRTTYNISTAGALASESYWPAEDYLNIWVTNISSGFLGFAQFPISNLDGLNQQQTINPLTDGVVVDWRYTGTGFNARDFSKGRTATHEIGHYLGLRHIHGDLGCNKDDFCEDTPLKAGNTNGCPAPGSEESCGSVDMFQNYMNLSDDVCMNLFTNCQSERMRTILQVSPRRRTLLTSKGATDPVIVANDLGIRQVLSPLNGNCENTLTPQIEVRNYGTNEISQYTVELYVDGALQESVSKDVNLAKVSTAVVSFSPIATLQGTNTTLRFEIVAVNNTTDGNAENNQKIVSTNIPNQDVLPHLEDFEGTPSTWTITNDQLANPSWSIGNAPKDIFENQGAVLAYYNSPAEKYGEQDFLVSPVLDLSSLPAADLSFKYAFAPRTSNITDVLTVAVSTDCGQTFPVANQIFQRFSPSLGTTNTTDELYIPQGPDEWEEVNINITEFVGSSEVVIAFIGHNGGGNNLYLDDISLTTSNLLAYDVGITEVTNLPVTTCFNTIFPTVQVKNFGFEIINSFDLLYTFNGTTTTQRVENSIVLPGKTKSVLVELSGVDPGDYTVDFEVVRPNGQSDEQVQNDKFQANIRLNNNEDVIPLREQFKTSIEQSDWTFIRPDTSHNWKIENVLGNGNGNAALLLDAFNISEIGVENWLISPVLNFSNLEAASLFFKVSHGNIAGRNDRLQVYVSVNCGHNFETIVYDKKGDDLAVKASAEEWFPATEEDWRTEFIDLSEFTVSQDVRIAFVITSQNGNNIFLDDIEFFTAADPNPLEIGSEAMRLFPNPATTSVNLKFDLNNRVDLTLSLTNLAGEVVFKEFLKATLNQTFSINNLEVDNGIYIINVTGPGTNISRRIWINR